MKPFKRLIPILVIVTALTMSHFAYSQNNNGRKNPDLLQQNHIALAPGGATMVVTPGTLNQLLFPNTTVTQVLNIANTGDSALNFSIEITYPPDAVKSRSTIYYNQTGNPSSEGGIPSQNFPDYPANSCAGADDFIVPPGATWNVNHIYVNGAYWGDNPVPAVDVVFYADESGYPGSAVATFAGIPCVGEYGGAINIFLPSTVILTDGQYWVSVAAAMDLGIYGQWYWNKEAAPAILHELAWQNPGGGFMGCTSWCYGPVQFPDRTDYNLSFSLSDSIYSPPLPHWLSVAPLTGSVPPGYSVDVVVAFDATGMTLGIYDGMIQVTGNDTVNPVTQVPVTLTVVSNIGLEFFEDWATGSFATNEWSFNPEQANWSVTSDHGNQAPSAMFNWTPALTNYSCALVTPTLNGTNITDNVTVKFDLELDNFSTATTESMAVEVYDGSSWHLVHDYSNVSGSFSFISQSFNITSIAAGHTFSVRFRAHGENSFNINQWYVDNIKIYEQAVGNLAGTITRLSDGSPVEGAIITISNEFSGPYADTTDNNGVYTITGAESGYYTLTVNKTGFNSVTDYVTIAGNQTLTRDYPLTAPIISVTPDSLAVTVAAGETDTRIVTICNTGNGPLSWHGDILPGDSTWAMCDPVSGIIAPGECQDVTVIFDGNYIPLQKDLTLTGNLIIASDPDVGSPGVALQLHITGEINGVLEGMVTHGGVPVDSVTVTATRSESPVHIYTMITGTNGEYSFPEIYYGTYDLTAAKPGFNNFSSSGSVTVTGGQTTVFDITMTAPVMVMDPPVIDQYVPFDQIVTRILTVTNTGDGSLDWEAAVATGFKRKVSIPAGDGNFPRGNAPVSMGRAPTCNFSPSGPMLKPKGSLGYAFNVYPGYNFFSFDTDDPGNQDVISQIDFYPTGGTFDANNTDFMYVVDLENVLKKVDIATGNVTNVGPCTPYAGQTWSGITVDKITNLMYGISSNGSESFLYAINKETGGATVIGPTGMPGAIDVAIDGAGQMYSFDIVTDASYLIDKETGASTLLGSIGFDANYGQGMGWDPVSDIVFMTAYNIASGTGELRILDRESGNTVLVGELGCNADALAFPGNGSTWLSIDKYSGTLPAGATDTITVTLDGTWVPPREFGHGTITFSSDPDVGTVVVPVNLLDPPWQSYLQGYVTHDEIPVPNAIVTATRQGHAPYTAVTGADGHYLIGQLVEGAYDVTATATGFNPYNNPGVIIYHADTTTLDIYLAAPAMNITPWELEVNLRPGETATRWLTIANTGDGLVEVRGSAHVNTKLIGPGASAGYAFDVAAGTFFSFDPDDPGTTTIISTIDFTPAGAAFDAFNTDFVYVIDGTTNLLKKVEVATGAVTNVGTATTYGPQTWTGITVDKTTNIMYGIATDMTESLLYMIDMATANTVLIGYTGIHGAMDLTVDGTGQMYSVDIVNDEAYTIDKETATANLLGTLGYDAAGALGMGWDPETDIVFLTTYNNSSQTGELRTLDRMTGNTVLIGNMGGEIDGLAFPGESWSWLSINTQPVLVQPGSSVQMPVEFDATELSTGAYTGYLTFLSDPDVGTVVLPVTLNVSFEGWPTLTIDEVIVRNPDPMPVSVSVYADEISNMGSFRFTLDYDTSQLTYTGTSNWYPGITNVLAGNPSAGKLTFVWAASTEGVTISDGNFFNIDFMFHGSIMLPPAVIAWSDNPIQREFADLDGNIFMPDFHNGWVFLLITGLSENGPQSIKVYPNPASDEVTVKSDFAIQNIEILSSLGQRIYTKGYPGDNEVQIKVSALSPGIYFVKVSTEKGVGMVKVSVEH